MIEIAYNAKDRQSMPGTAGCRIDGGSSVSLSQLGSMEVDRTKQVRESDASGRRERPNARDH